MANQRHDLEKRPSPDALLEAARREDDQAGRLKIFVGAAPGVGKTYEMLQRAHARLPDLRRPYGMLAKLKPPIEFDAIDGQAVDIVFVLLLPANSESGNLGALALVARALRASETLGRLRSAKDASELYCAMVKADAI